MIDMTCESLTFKEIKFLQNCFGFIQTYSLSLSFKY